MRSHEKQSKGSTKIMFNLQLHISPQTEQRLKTILAHAQDQETFAQNIIAYQVAELQKGIVNIRLDLKKFEKKYKQPTEEFYQQYTQGQTDDSEDSMLWAGLYEMLRDNESKLRELLPDTVPVNMLTGNTLCLFLLPKKNV